MFKLLAAATLLVLGVAGAPAAAGTYDAFASFNGVQGSGHYTYGGYIDGAASPFTQFTSTSGCATFMSAATCLHDAALPGVFKTSAGAHQSGSVQVPGDRLILHPGPTDSAVYVMFTSVSLNTYDMNSIFTVQDDSPTGVDVSYFTIIGGVLDIHYASYLSADADHFYYSQAPILAAGDSLGFIVDKGATYNNDSTGISLTVTSLPEPATWSLLIGGFSLTGFAMRRRRVALAA